MLLGQQLHGLDEWNLWAVPVSDDVDHQRAAILELTRRTVQEFGLPVEPGEADLRFIDGYVGEGYAIPYAQDIATVRHVARMEGILLDPVYTGKACCALLDGIRAGRFGRERPVIHLLTGGLFSNFAWPELLLGT
jgi:D-cysteine desulfhydrase